jgi:hypothetical protein
VFSFDNIIKDINVEELLANWLAPEVIITRKFIQASDIIHVTFDKVLILYKGYCEHNTCRQNLFSFFCNTRTDEDNRDLISIKSLTTNSFIYLILLPSLYCSEIINIFF